MGTGVTLSTKPPENLKEQKPKGFENRIVKLEGRTVQALVARQ
jgi:ribosomal protein L34